MKGLDRCWQVILEKEEKDGRKSRSLAAIKLIKVAWVLQAAYSSHANRTATAWAPFFFCGRFHVNLPCETPLNVSFIGQRPPFVRACWFVLWSKLKFWAPFVSIGSAAAS